MQKSHSVSRRILHEGFVDVCCWGMFGSVITSAVISEATTRSALPRHGSLTVVSDEEASVPHSIIKLHETTRSREEALQRALAEEEAVSELSSNCSSETVTALVRRLLRPVGATHRKAHAWRRKRNGKDKRCKLCRKAISVYCRSFRLTCRCSAVASSVWQEEAALERARAEAAPSWW